jgi:hypothetical protein
MLRRLRCVFAFLVLVSAVISAVKGADIQSSLQIRPNPVARGGVFSIEIPNGSTASKATVTLIAGGTQRAASDVNVDAKAIPGSVVVTAKTPDDIELGDYDVTIALEGAKDLNHGRLRVRPPGITNIVLDKFVPDSTDQTSKNPLGGRVVTLTLQGKGFVEPGADKKAGYSIWINNRRLPVVWDQCPAGEADTGVHGQFISSEQILLCNVPVPKGGIMLVKAGYGELPENGQTFVVYGMTKSEAAAISFAVTLALSLLVFLLIFGVKSYIIIEGGTKAHEYRIRKLLLDPETNTYSLSKLQFYAWTAAALFAYSYLYVSKVLVQHLAWPDIPSSLPGIVGIGAGTAIGSQVVTNTMGSKGAGGELPSPSDFLTSGGVAAPDRIQMFLWTIFGVIAFCVGVLQKAPGAIREIAPVPEGMLYMMGLSAAGYLGGKLARKPGPVISEVFVNPPDPDDAIAQSVITGADLPELGQAAVPAQVALNTLPSATHPGATAALDALRAAIQETTSAHTMNEITDLIAGLAKFRADAEAGADQAAADFAKDDKFQRDAQTAQMAAAVLQDLAANVTAAISQASIPAMEGASSSLTVARTIEIRGTSLSPEATFDIDHIELPFRMLSNSDGQNAPEVVLRDNGGTFARILRLSMDPAKLGATDLAQYRKWFGAQSSKLLTITNPDGQKAELSFSLPPAAAQKSGEPGAKTEAA